jgi:hypothetical protein
MTEIVSSDTDTATQDGTSEESSAPNGQVDFGSDLLPDTSPDESQADSGHQAPAESDVSDISLDTPETQIPDSLRPAHRRMQGDYTQDLADRVRAFEAQQQEFAQERQQYLAAIQQAQQPQQQADPFADIYGRLQSPEERQGVDTVRQIFGLEMQQALIPLQELRQQFEQFQSQYGQLNEQMSGITGLVSSQRQAAITTEVQAAREAYGEEVVQNHAEDIRANYGRTNPATGRPYTVSDLAGIFSGETARQAQEARATDRQVRTTAQRRTRTPASTSADVNGGALSVEEAANLIGQMEGFE